MSRFLPALVVGLWMLLIGLPGPAEAQDAGGTTGSQHDLGSLFPPDSTVHAADIVISTTDEPHLTLEGWAENRRFQMTARRHAYGDLTYDRGVFRHITPLMDREYALDMTNYRFSPLEDYTWERVRSGMRVSTGSIVRAEWGLLTEITHTGSIGDGHALGVDATLQQDGRAQRASVEIRYDWTFAPGHHAGIRHTFSNYKPDFDPSFYYQYGNTHDGRARAEVTLLDAYNNLIFSTLGVSEKDEDFVRIYDRIPVLAQITLETPERYALRAEVHAGWQPESELAVQKQTDASYRYRDEETAHYVGGLIEYNHGPVTTGLIAQRDFSRLKRQGLRAAVSSNYETEQRFQRAGVFVIGSWRSLRAEGWFFLEDYYDRQHGSDFSLSTVGQSMDYTEYRKNYRFRLAYVPNRTGWYASVEYLGMSRRLGDKPWILGNEWTNHWFQLAPSNYRLANVVGYRFGAGAIAFGINYDLDGDKHYKAGPDYQKKRFDNGYLRFSWSW